MKRFVIGVVVASVVLYVWGFLYWGLGPYRTMIWKQASDDRAAMAALREHFPENGTYYVPGLTHEAEALNELFAEGPLAFVHILSADGGLVFDPAIMIKGFFSNVVVVILIALLMQQVAPALPTFGDQVRFAVVGALAAAVLIDLSDSVWWRLGWDWQFYRAFYHFVAWALTSVIVARFVGTRTTERVGPVPTGRTGEHAAGR